MSIITFIAPPLSGKGTQAKQIELRTAWKHVSTGDLLRDRMNGNDDVAKAIQKTMAKGQFASEDIVNQVLQDRLAQPDCQNGLILDGYPRHLAQAHKLDSFIKQANAAFAGAIHIDVPEKELFNRLAARGRADDKPELLKKRLEDYKNLTLPLVDFYRQRGELIEIDGRKPMDEVTKDICIALNIKP